MDTRLHQPAFIHNLLDFCIAELLRARQGTIHIQKMSIPFEKTIHNFNCHRNAFVQQSERNS
jgi:hypothetical protein